MSTEIECTLYVSPEEPKEARKEFLAEAARKGVTFLDQVGEFFLSPSGSPDLIWATDYAPSAYRIPVESISMGAKNLRACLAEAIEANPSRPKVRWIQLPGRNHRRATLIADALRAKPIPLLGFPPETRSMEGQSEGFAETRWVGFFLLSEREALAVPQSLTPIPGGGLPFKEEKAGPPSRAYLKIWEALTRIYLQGASIPKAGDRVVDLGSCPGGWTWALAKLGCEVVSVDGAPLEPSVARLPGVHFLKKDAFKLDPNEVLKSFEGSTPERIDWLFSDMICEPKRLPPLLRRWIDSGICENFVISVKFKGEADLEAIQELEALGAESARTGLRHLRHNKHEVTWFHLAGMNRIECP